MIAIVTIGILGSIITMNGKDQTKKAYKIEIKTQFNAASKKLMPALMGSSVLQESERLEYSKLNDSQTYTYSCNKRENGANIFDIRVKQLLDIGGGGILSFGKN